MTLDKLAGRSLAEIITFVLNDFHEPLRADLTRIEELARKVAKAHGKVEKVKLIRLAETIEDLAEELRSHMRVEEEVLFPWILAGRGSAASEPAKNMLAEHEGHTAQLSEIEWLTDRFTAPATASEPWKELYRELAQLDASLKDHLLVEQKLLFADLARE